MIRVFISSLGRYNAGELTGMWLELPATEEELKHAFKVAKVTKDDEYFLTDYESDVYGVADCINEYSRVEKLNEIADEMLSLDDYELEKLEAYLEVESVTNLNELYEIITTIDDIEMYIYPCETEYELGEYIINEMYGGIENVVGNKLGEQYFDYASYGRDLAFNMTATQHGYVEIP